MAEAINSVTQVETGSPGVGAGQVDRQYADTQTHVLTVPRHAHERQTNIDTLHPHTETQRHRYQFGTQTHTQGDHDHTHPQHTPREPLLSLAHSQKR